MEFDLSDEEIRELAEDLGVSEDTARALLGPSNTRGGDEGRRRDRDAVIAFIAGLLARY